MIKRLLLAIAPALLLAGCFGDDPPPQPLPAAPAGPTVSASNPVVAAIDSVLIHGTQAMILADLAYEGAVASASAAVDAGLLRGEAAGRAQTLNREAMTWLDRGKRATDQAEKAKAAAHIFELVGRIRSIVGR